MFGQEPQIGKKVKLYNGQYKGNTGILKKADSKFEYFIVDIPKIGKVKVRYEDVFNYTEDQYNKIIKSADAAKNKIKEGMGAQGQMIDPGDEVSIIQKAISKLPARVQSLIKPNQKYKVISSLGDTATLAIADFKVNVPTNFLDKPINWESLNPAKKVIKESPASQPTWYKKASGEHAEVWHDGFTIFFNKEGLKDKQERWPNSKEAEKWLLQHNYQILTETIMKKSTLKKAIYEMVLAEVSRQEVANLVDRKAEAAMKYRKATGEVKTYFGRFVKMNGENVYVGVLGKGIRSFKIASIQALSPAKLESKQKAELDEMCNKFETSALVHRNSDRMRAEKKKKDEYMEPQSLPADKTAILKKEACPPGFKGTVKAMKSKHPDKFSKDEDKKINPYALAWSMKNKGMKSHYTAGGKKKVDEVL
jgi:hypothetical protein